MTGRRRRLLVGLAVAGMVVAALLYAVGPEEVLDRLSRADPAVFSLGFLAVLAAMYCWSEALAELLDGVDTPVGGVRYRGAYLSAAFLRKMVPMGQAAGPLFLAYLVSRETEAPYDTTLAATSVFSLLNIVTSVVLAALALAVLVATGATPSGPLFLGLLVILVGSVVGIAVTLGLLWRRRSTLERSAVRVADGVGRTVGRVSTRVESALAPERVRETVADLSGALDGVLANWRAVAVASALSVAGWAFFLAPIYTGVLALDERVPYALVAFVVPMVMMVNVMPLPGGFGGFDVAVAALLSTLGGIGLPTAAAALFLYRLSNYWFVVLIGGLASLALSLSVEDPPPVVLEDSPEADPDPDPEVDDVVGGTTLLHGEEETS